jgi:hypothetical protein
MGARFGWDNNEQTTILYTLEGEWTLDEFRQTLDAMAQTILAKPHLVHVITDLTHATQPPARLLSAARYVDTTVQTNTGLIVFVNPMGMMVMLMKMAMGLMPGVAARARYADTIEQAREIIRLHIEMSNAA